MWLRELLLERETRLGRVLVQTRKAGSGNTQLSQILNSNPREWGTDTDGSVLLAAMKPSVFAVAAPLWMFMGHFLCGWDLFSLHSRDSGEIITHINRATENCFTNTLIKAARDCEQTSLSAAGSTAAKTINSW